MMPLLPENQEMTWNEVQASLSDIPLEAERIWMAAGIIDSMPDGSGDELLLTAMEEILTATATALQIPQAEIYSRRGEIRWIWFGGLGDRMRHFASLAGGKPAQLNA